MLDTTYEVGLSGPGRLHDLFVTHEAVTPGSLPRARRRALVRYGYHPSPFGTALVMATEYGLAGLAFADEGGEQAALADMMRRWPRAEYVEDAAATAPLAGRIFNPENGAPRPPLRVVLIGTRFRDPRLGDAAEGAGRLRHDLFRSSPAASRSRARRAPSARAVGSNPISFVVPCHRVLGRSGSLTGYHWGLTRKRAILGWEAGMVAG